jgi:hypothetical protein
MRVFAKVDGKLAVWDCSPDTHHTFAINFVRDELGVGHKGAILALVKY